MEEWVCDDGRADRGRLRGARRGGQGRHDQAHDRAHQPAHHAASSRCPKPTERERTQWYFQRYVAHLPAGGEIALFDRSWYNRAGVEHVLGFCSPQDYQLFLRQCPIFERLLVEDGIILLKYWFSVCDEEQERRFRKRDRRPDAPLEALRDRPVRATQWVDYSRAKDEMFVHTDIPEAPWYVVEADDKRRARINCMAHVLSQVPWVSRPEPDIELPPRQSDVGYVRPPRDIYTSVPDHAAYAGRVTFPVRAAGVSLALVVLVSCTGGTAAPSPTPPPVQVRLDGEALAIAPGTTLGAVLTAADLVPEAGHLLAVDGTVLERKAYPGRIELNGRLAARSTVLRTGDRIRIVDGTDKTEPTVRIVRNMSPRVGDPERTLTVYPTRRITIQGRVSGIVASVTDRSIGRGRAPRAVALTFDDGPWPGATERILRILHRFHVRATFFEIGSLASQHPRLVGRVLAGGNEIGNHTFDHPETMAHQSADQIAAELRHASAVLADEGVAATLFRPPGGWFDDELGAAGSRAGHAPRHLGRRPARLALARDAEGDLARGPLTGARGLDRAAARRWRRCGAHDPGVAGDHQGHPGAGPGVRDHPRRTDLSHLD